MAIYFNDVDAVATSVEYYANMQETDGDTVLRLSIPLISESYLPSEDYVALLDAFVLNVVAAIVAHTNTTVPIVAKRFYPAEASIEPVTIS